LKIKDFMRVKRVRNSDDLGIQYQLFAYFVSKHYNISLWETLNMPLDIFYQSLNWAVVMQEREDQERSKESLSNATSNETITLDYSFLNSEDGEW